MRTVSSVLALSSCTFALLVAGGARADGPKRNDNVPFTLSRDTLSSGPAARGRALAAQGNCEAALDAFDDALRHTVDPAVFRDRGYCHEKLGHTFPAIDDYRAYLSQAPDAPDGDKVRERLLGLEGQVPEETRNVGSGGDYEYEMRGGVGFRRNDKATPPPVKDDPAEKVDAHADPNKPLTEIEAEEKAVRDAASSPVRGGKGPILGFFALYRDWVRSGFSFTQTYGLAARYSLTAGSTVLLEVGYVNVASSGTASQLSGLGTLLGYEGRISLDRYAANHLLLGAGLGYERVKQDASGLVFSSFVPRARAGWRHAFGASIALEITGDGGAMITHAVGAPPGTQADVVSAVFGGSAAFLVGF